jgi:pilus assembly protein CpaE
VGATTIAVRTAWRLAENPPRAVVLIDLDLQFGDAVLQLDATPNHALREALARAERVDDLFLERGIIHITKRLDLLASMEPLEGAIGFEESAFLSLLGILRHRYRYIVVDLPTPSAIAMPRLLREPSLMILVSDEGLASAREVARLRQLRGVNSPEHTMVHVLNKSGGPGSLPLPEFERGAGQAPDVTIPWSRDIATAANLGVRIRPDCPVLDNALAPVFSRLTGEKPPDRRSFLSKLLG